MTHLVDTLEIMRLMKEFLARLQINGQPTFAEVRFYAHVNLLQAMRRLLIFDDRACLIIPTGNTHTNQRIGDRLRTWRTTEFTLLLSDRVYGDFDAEALQGNAENPGTVALADLVVASLTGQQLDNPRLNFEPGNGEPFHIAPDEGEQMPGRDCWAQTFTTPAGFMEVALATLVDQRRGE